MKLQRIIQIHINAISMSTRKNNTENHKPGRRWATSQYDRNIIPCFYPIHLDKFDRATRNQTCVFGGVWVRSIFTENHTIHYTIKCENSLIEISKDFRVDTKSPCLIAQLEYRRISAYREWVHNSGGNCLCRWLMAIIARGLHPSWLVDFTHQHMAIPIAESSTCEWDWFQSLAFLDSTSPVGDTTLNATMNQVFHIW